MSKDDSSKEILDEKSLAQLRDILLGKDSSFTTEKVKQQSREIVKDVIAEALNDRQKQDGDIDTILQPIVERSVEASFTNRSDKLISSLYPLVGGLVRKSVKAFLNDFIEKTNQLLENSFTLKSIKWRIKARQAGIPFAQYIASQTFVYRVEHILLIHRETGILLNSVNNNEFSDSNVDLISSMLTAINDFVADSLITNDEAEEQLQTIRTNNFSLLLKPGPDVMVVAAVTGNPPHSLLEKIQLTLENIHRFYDEELYKFNGNTKPFNSTAILLNNCLLSEEKDSVKNSQKTSWVLYCLLISFFIGSCYILFNSWKNNVLEQKLIKLNEQPGYTIQALNVHFDHTIELDIIRDPTTPPVIEWLNNQHINTTKLQLTEQLFYSADPIVIKQKIARILNDYPQVNFNLDNEKLILSGTVSITNKEVLLNKLSDIASPLAISIETSALNYDTSIEQTRVSNVKQQQELFFLLLAEFNLYQLDFDINQSEISQAMHYKLDDVVGKYQQLDLLAQQVNYNLALIIIGTGGTTGNQINNKALSLTRANNVKHVLINKGLSKEMLHTSNIGTMSFQRKKDNLNKIKTRKVLFNVVYIDMNQMEK